MLRTYGYDLTQYIVGITYFTRTHLSYNLSIELNGLEKFLAPLVFGWCVPY